jgi:hypothetical protein
VTVRENGSPDQVQSLKRYARSMGIDPRVIDVAESIPHEQIKTLNAREIRQYRLGVERLPRAR